MTASARQVTGRSLVDYVKGERRKSCPVCKLPITVRSQLATATDKKIRRATVLAWLKSEIKATVTDEDLTAHRNGKHDA